MNVLSLFDGMSCGQIALNKLGIKYDNYFASEIDKYAMQVTQKNYPNTKQIGSVTEVRGEDLPKIDLLFGGSPCQSFSRAGDGSGFDGKSKLFWEFVRILKETKPKYFLLENVKMKQEWEQVITDALGVKPIAINSKLVSAQNRPRLFWTNIPNIKQPKDLGLTIKDVIDADFSETYPNYLDLQFGGKKRKDLVQLYTKKASCLLASMYKGKVSSFCKNENGDIYKYTPQDCEVLQTVPINYTDCVSNTQRYKMLGNGWTVDVIAHIFKNLTNQK
jgi:DNA (cytosine-5)-methyltransferase 3A